MTKLGTAVLSIVFSVLLVGQAAAAPILLTDAAAPNTSNGNVPSANSVRSAQSPQIGATIDQDASFSINDTQRVIKGATYTTTVTVTTDKRGLLSAISVPELSSPRLSVDISGNDAQIVNIESEDYDSIDCSLPTESNCEITSSSPFGPGEVHQVTVQFRVPRGASTESVTLTATPNTGDEASVSLGVEETGNAFASQARIAQAKADIATGYRRTYDGLLAREDLDEETQESIQRGFTVAANEMATSAAVGYADQAISGVQTFDRANSLASIQNAKTSYGLVSGSGGNPTTAAKINRISYRLWSDLNQEMITDDVRRAGNSSYALAELARLSRLQAQAWENGNRKRVREILQRKYYVLTGLSGPGDGPDPAWRRTYEQEYSSEALTSTDTPFLLSLSRSQAYAAEGQSPTLHNYFSNLNDYANSELQYISETALPATRTPSPGVRVESGQADLQSRLSELEQGDTVTVTFTVSNGEQAGTTGLGGYLSVSHSDELKLTGFEQVSETSDEPVTVVNSSVGDEITTRGGNTTEASHPLTDIYEQYEPGETNTYRLTFKSETDVSSNDVWIAYRTAFEPLIHEENAGKDRFERYPKQNRADGVDQQNSHVFNVSSSPDTSDSPPTAVLELSDSTVTVDESVLVGTELSTDDREITSRSLSVNGSGGNTDVARNGNQFTIAFPSPGQYGLTLTVADSAGQEDIATANVRVTPSPSPEASFEAEQSIVQPGNTTTLTATSQADSYAWDLDGDGNYDDATNRTVSWTPPSSGEYEVGLQISKEGQTDTVSYTYTVEGAVQRLTNPSPVITGPTSVQPGDTAVFSATQTEDTAVVDGELVEGEIASYEWDIDSDDEIEKTGEEVQIDFSDESSRIINLSVTDRDGYTATATRLVNVSGSSSEQDKSEYVDVDPSDLPGDGSQSSPYEISNASELQAMEDDLDANYELVSDIDASETAQFNNGSGFDPVGSVTDEFTGSFDGNNHSITKLKIDRPNKDYGGLFGVSEGTVIDVTLVDITVTGGVRVGGIVGNNERSGTIRNAAVSGSVAGEGRVGGLVGYNHYGTIQNATASGSVNGTGGSVGGLVGYNDNGKIRDVAASESVAGEGQVGGLVGYNHDGTIQNATASGSVNGTASYVGGLVGNNLDGAIRNATASGSVTGENTVGGLVGINRGTIREVAASGNVTGEGQVGGITGFNSKTIQNVTASGSVTGENTVGGLVGYHNAGTIRDAAASGSVTGNRDVGGLVGANRANIQDAFATGSVTGGFSVGGVVGRKVPYGTPATMDAYWDEQATDQSTSAGTATGLTTAQMQGQAARTNMTGLEFGTVWQTQPDDYPTLIALQEQGDSEEDNERSGGESQQVDVDPSDLPGDGSQSNPYEISNASELQAMEDDLDAHYILVEDINASNTAQWNNGNGFAPVGGSSRISSTPPPFTGSLDGNNYTVTGLTIDRSDERYIGLFGESEGKVSNLSLTDLIITGNDFVGGLVGRNNGGKIMSATASGSVTGSGAVGGLVGGNGGKITSATASSSVTGSEGVGGLIGGNGGGAVRNATASGSVSGSAEVGGLVGRNVFVVSDSILTGTVRDTFAVGPVSGDSEVGGVVGNNTVAGSTGTITDSYWDTQATNQSNSAGNATGLATAQMQGQAARTNMSGLGFETIWQTTNGYPELRPLTGAARSPTATVESISTTPDSDTVTTVLNFSDVDQGTVLVDIQTETGSSLVSSPVIVNSEQRGEAVDIGLTRTVENETIFVTVTETQSAMTELANRTVAVPAADEDGGGPSDPGGGGGDVPGGDVIASFSGTTPLSTAQLQPGSLSGKIRVEQQAAENISVELLRSSRWNYSLAITGPDDAENVTVYLQTQAISSSQNIENFTVFVNDSQRNFEVAAPGNSPWVGFVIPHFSTQVVTITSGTELYNASVSPTTIQSGESVTVEATLENTNSESETVTLNLTDNRTQIGTQEVTVDGGQKTTVTFTTTLDEPGERELQISGLSAGNVTVEETITTESTETETSSKAPGFGPVVTLVALLSAVLLVFKRIE